MIYGFWQEKIYDADVVSEKEKSERLETAIRKASKRHELRCIDPECSSPILCYKHGPKRMPHFAHLTASECDYAAFEKLDKPIVKKIRTILYNHFINLGYDVQREIKLPKGKKYCHLLIKKYVQNFVLQISSSTTSAQYIEDFTKECEQNRYKLLWIAIGDTNDLHLSDHHYCAMRYQFYHTTNSNLLIINSEGTEVSQTKEDFNKYEYKQHKLGERYFSENIHNFRLVRPLENLVISDCEITIDTFFESYNSWMSRKRIAFEKMKADVDEAEKRNMKLEEQNHLRQEQTQRNAFNKWKTNTGYKDNQQSRLNPYKTIPFKQTEPTSKIISDYKINTKVLHSKYGYGTIIEVKNKENSTRHLIRIIYDNGKTWEHELEVLIAAGTISIRS